MGIRGKRQITTTPTRGRRLIWVDVARGTLICLVVAYHVISVHLVTPLVATDSDTERVMTELLAAIRPVRMPLFFVISGLLARSSLERPWSRLLRSKTLFFYYLYLIWLVLHTTLLIALHNTDLLSRMGTPAMTEGPAAALRGLVVNAVFSPTNLWFLFALALYYPLAKLLRGVRWWTLGAAFTVYALSAEGWPGRPFEHLASVAAFFAWFLVGAYGKDAIDRVVALPRWVTLPVASVLFVVPQVVEIALGGRQTVLLGLASAGGVCLGILAALWISERVASATRLLSYLGARTLPIYVMHMPIVWIWHSFVLSPMVELRLAGAAPTLLYTLAVTVGTLAASTGLYALTRKRLPLLFRLPRKARHRARIRNTRTTATRASARRTPAPLDPAYQEFIDARAELTR